MTGRSHEGVLDGPRLRQAVPTLSLLVVVSAVEIVLVAATALGDLSAWQLGVGHTVAVGCLAVWTVRRRHRQCDVRLSAIGTLGVATCGPLGAAGALLAFVVHATGRREEAINSPQEQQASAQQQRISSVPDPDRLHGGVASFNDVMTLGTVDEKRAAISLMSARFCQEFTPALKRALRDPDPAVRVQAATAVSRLENQFQQRVLELEGKAEAGGAAERLELAGYLDEVAETGLLDEERSASWRSRALALYQAEAVGRLADLALPLGRALVRLGREQQACVWFERLPSSVPMTARLLYWRLEALYRAGRYGQLRSLCRQHQQLLAAAPTAPPPVVAAVAFWGACA